MPLVARPRSTPPSTPFGVWLDMWFHDHEGVTLEAFAQDVGVTKSAVSLWIGATRPVAIRPGTVRSIALRTGADLADLERMVYGSAPTRPPGERTINLSPEELQGLLERAAEIAVRKVLDDPARGFRVA